MSISFQKLLGYAPDFDPTIPGVITAGTGIRPTTRGYAAAYSAVAVGSQTIAASCVGAAVLTKGSTGEIATYFGSATKLYRWSGATQVDISGRTYSASTTARWSMCAFGDIGLFSNTNDTIQFGSVGASAAAADVSGAPKASFIESVGQFVFAAGTNDATYGAQADRWWCCAIGNYADWTPSIATQSATGRLLSSPGPMTGMKKFGDDVLIYKRDAIYRGTYVGPPVIWAFERVPGDIGTWSNEAIVVIGTSDQPKHIFWGPKGFFVYDGSRAEKIGDQELFKTVYDAIGISASLVQYFAAAHNARDKLIHFFYSTTGSTPFNKCILYDYANNKWGVDDRSVSFPFSHNNPSFVGSFPVVPDVRAAYYGTDNNLYILNSTVSAGTTSTITLGDYGSEEQETLLRRVRPRFLTKPASATMSDIYRQSAGDTGVTSTAVTMASSGNFDLLQEARFHRPTFNMTGHWEIDGVSFDAEPTGTE